jgi:hypothetical protein
VPHLTARYSLDFNPILHDGQRYYPITVAVRHSLQPKQLYIHWTTDNWRSTQVTPCFFYRMHWDKSRGSSARNPNRYDTSIWISQITVVTVPRALIAETINVIAVLAGRGCERRLTELAPVEGLGPTGDYVLTSVVDLTSAGVNT